MNISHIVVIIAGFGVVIYWAWVIRDIRRERRERKKVRRGCSAGIVNDVCWIWDLTWEPGEGLD